MASTNSTSFSYLSTTGNRFTGLASGMDIDSIVEKLMKAESAKMEKLQQQKQKYEWQRDAYRGINVKLEAFRTEAFDKYKPSTFSTKSVSVSDSSKVSVTASSSAAGSLEISSVKLAKAARLKIDLKNSPADGSATLKSLGLNADQGKLTFNVLQKDGSMKETEIEYQGTDTIDQLVSKINNSGAGLTAIFGNGQLSLSTSSTGAGTVDEGPSLQVLSDTGNLFESAKDPNTGEIAANGVNAEYTVNGITKTSQTNSFSELGYSITLNKEFNETDGVVSISSTTDTQSVIDQVKSFVELYNGLIESMNTPIKERKDYNYQPLTDAQKAAMSEDEIKKWEEKAKQGTLRNDTAISSVVSNMRTALYSIGTDKDSKYNTLFNIGITTSAEYKDGGKLVIDEKKLKAAIEANPEVVSDLFTRSAGTNGSDDKGGLITQLREVAKTGIDTIAAKAGKEGAVANSYTLGKTIISVEDRISTWKDKLKSIEERYFKQFSAMEAAIQKANSQSSLFMQG